MFANITIRQAQKRDREQLIPLGIELFGANNDPSDRPLAPNYAEIITRSWGKVNFRKSLVLVAEHRAKIVGYAKGHLFDGDPMYTYKKGALVEELVVHQPMQRQGVGRVLLAAFEKFVREKGAERVMLSSDAHTTTRAFYEKVDYHVSSHRMLKVFR